ncbi:hypothetical protein BDV18DRAFT_158267 [Aspergillus unguis]
MPDFRYFRYDKYSLSAAGIIVSVYCFLYVFSVGYYRRVSYRDPTSFFFDANRAYERQYSAQRVAEAETFLDKARHMIPGDHGIPGQDPRLCVGIVSVARRGEQYVGLTVGSLLDGLSSTDRNEMLLYLRIGNTSPKDHPLNGEQWVQKVPDRLLTYSEADPDFQQLQEWEEGGWYRNKTIYDFTTLMRECYDSGAEYVAMLEDDTLAVKGWFPAAMRALETVKERASGRDWIYLRLFYIDGLLGWNGEEWPKYLFWSFVVWAVITGAMLAAKRKFKTELKSIPMNAIWITSFIFIPAAIVLHFLAGRQTMWPISPGVHEMNKYGCCSQGLVFPRSIIPRFLEKTDLTTDWLVDMMVEKIADSQEWLRYAVVPPLLQHIGATSSKGYGFDNSASTIWNFLFERYPASGHS